MREESSAIPFLRSIDPEIIFREIEIIRIRQFRLHQLDKFLKQKRELKSVNKQISFVTTYFVVSDTDQLEILLFGTRNDQSRQSGR
jgi:hypothetical protein